MASLPRLAPRVPGQTLPGTEKPGSKEHTEAEWASKKELIRRLYITDQCKLVEIMAILQSRHGFAATEQMYKKRLKKWNIRKRSYRKSTQNSTASTPASSSSGVCSPEESLGTEELPREGSAMTLIRPSKLEPYAGLELVLDSVCSWSRGKLESPRVVSDPMSRYLANPNQPPIQDSRTMYRTFELVFDLWKHGKGNLAGMAARKGFYVLEFVLTEDHPDLVWHVLDTIFDMVDSGHLQLLTLFVEHATVLGQRQLPGNHPLLRILHQLRKCDYRTDKGRQYVCHLLRQAWLRNVDILGDQIGTQMPQHLWLYEQLIWDGRTRLRRESPLARRQTAMLTALEGLANQPQSDLDDDDSEKLRIKALMLEFTQMDLGDRKRAEELAIDLLRETNADLSTRSSARFHAYARKMLARIYEDRQDWDNAEENLRFAIAKREAAHGANNNLRVVRDMWVLASHFQRVGRQEDSDRIAQDAITRAQQYLDDVPG